MRADPHAAHPRRACTVLPSAERGRSRQPARRVHCGSGSRSTQIQPGKAHEKVPLNCPFSNEEILDPRFLSDQILRTTKGWSPDSRLIPKRIALIRVGENETTKSW